MSHRGVVIGRKAFSVGAACDSATGDGSLSHRGVVIGRKAFSVGAAIGRPPVTVGTTMEWCTDKELSPCA